MIKRLIVNAFAALIGAAIIPGIKITSVPAALIFALVLGILNASLGNLMKLAGCLINLLTLGLFDWLVNAIVILLTGNLVSGVSVEGLWPAIFLALLMSFISTFVFDRTNEKD